MQKKNKAVEVIEGLRKKFPRASDAELAKRLVEMGRKDESLKEAMAEEFIRLKRNEEYDECVREGRDS